MKICAYDWSRSSIEPVMRWLMPCSMLLNLLSMRGDALELLANAESQALQQLVHVADGRELIEVAVEIAVAVV